MPRYPEAENPFGAQQERVESIRHFLGRQAANNPGLCMGKNHCLCASRQPPLLEQKGQWWSIMEKHAAKYSWEGGCKEILPRGSLLSKASTAPGLGVMGELVS